MNEQQKISLYNTYCKNLNRFCSKNELYLFNFSLDVLEKCTLIFEGELELEKPEDLTINYFELNYFQFKRISLQLNLPFKHTLIYDLFVLYCYVRTIINQASTACKLHRSSGFLVGEVMTQKEIEDFSREQKYKTNQRREILKNKGAKFEHHFYEFYFYKINVTSSLKFYDSIRRELLENGDTIELINNRDVITSVLKYFEYLSKGIKIART